MRIKICGMTNVADALKAAALGADAIGLNFYPESRRYVRGDQAEQIVRALPPFVEPVGLYVNPSFEELEEIFTRSVLNWFPTLQIYADHPEVLPDLPCRWITAFPVRDETSLALIDNFLERCRLHGRLPDAILVDAHVPCHYGGTGQVAPWELLAHYRPPVPLILAGGLTPDNVADAIRMVRPYAVDVASGVESAPGMKDANKMRHFIDRAREAAV
jgi:phosphoribosylanthranilate isomerase